MNNKDFIEILFEIRNRVNNGNISPNDRCKSITNLCDSRIKELTNEYEEEQENYCCVCGKVCIEDVSISEKTLCPDKNCEVHKDEPEEIEIINTNKKRTESEWLGIFGDWSEEMDNLYKGDYRHDATMWNENPTNWMEPYNDDVYNAWCDIDAGGSPYGGELLKEISKRKEK